MGDDGLRVLVACVGAVEHLDDQALELVGHLRQPRFVALRRRTLGARRLVEVVGDGLELRVLGARPRQAGLRVDLEGHADQLDWRPALALREAHLVFARLLQDGLDLLVAQAQQVGVLLDCRDLGRRQARGLAGCAVLAIDVQAVLAAFALADVGVGGRVLPAVVADVGVGGRVLPAVEVGAL